MEAAESAEAEMAKSTTLVGGDREAQSFLSPETLRLAISESAEDAGEVLAYATACLNALLSDPGAQVSDDDLDRLTPRVHVMLILESLQRRGYVRVDWGDVLDPMALDARIQIVGDLGPKRQ